MRKLGSVTAFQREKSHKSSGKFEARVNKKTSTAELFVYGQIGVDFFGDGVTAANFQKELKALGNVKTIDLHINSDGGVVTEARAMYALLLQHKATVNVHIDGIAASAASFLAMVGDTITITEGAFVMIHNASVVARGTAAELRKTADTMDLVNAAMVDTYAARTGQSVASIKAMMDEETWLDASEAVAKGFADTMTANKGKVVASSDMLADYSNVPAELRPGRAKALAIMKGLKL